MVAELGPTFYHVELPRELKESCDMVECLPTPASRCCVPLNQDDGVGRFIVGSDDGSLHTVFFPICSSHGDLERLGSSLFFFVTDWDSFSV